MCVRRAELDAYFTATQMKHSNASSFGLFGSAGISVGAFLIPPGATLPEIQLTLFPRKSEPHMSNSAGLDHVKEVLITIALLHPMARNRVVLVHDNDDSVDDNDIDDHLIPRVVSEVPESKPEHLREADVWKITWAIGVVREIAAVLGKSRQAVAILDALAADILALRVVLPAEKGLIGREISPGPDVASSKGIYLPCFVWLCRCVSAYVAVCCRLGQVGVQLGVPQLALGGQCIHGGLGGRRRCGQPLARLRH
jgi:hypothetical protein